MTMPSRHKALRFVPRKLDNVLYLFHNGDMQKSAFSRFGQPLSDDDRLEIKAWMEKRQRQVSGHPAPIKRGDKAILEDPGLAAIAFNETRSLAGPNIQEARINLVHAAINGDETWGPDRVKHARSAPSVLPHGVPEAERSTYEAAVAAVAAARAQRAQGIDPTGGALNFNFRTSTQSGSFQERSVKTRVGPLENSFPTKRLPAAGVYANTY